MVSWLPPVTDWHHSALMSVQPCASCVAPNWLHSPCQPPSPVRGIPGFGGLLQLFIQPSLQVHGTCVGVLPCQAQIIRNLRAVSGPLWLHTVWQHFYSVLTTQWGMLDVLCLVGFPQSHPAWRQFSPAFGSHIVLVPYSSPKSSLLQVPAATSNPLYSLLLHQYPQFTGEIREPQRS